VIVGADDSIFLIFGISVFFIHFPPQFTVVLKDEFGFFLMSSSAMARITLANCFAYSGVAGMKCPAS
jgi:hypothetical protein